MAEIEITNLSIRYGKQLVINDLTCSIPGAGITALMGPSGCGKSTLLGSINRMTDLIRGCEVRGEIQIDGQSIFDSRMELMELRRRVGMVFQQPTPFPISIARNLSIPLRELGLGKAEVQRRMEASLKSAGLWEEVANRLRQPAIELSGGQQQRLCIARALALEPQVLLLDEPCSALDQGSIETIEETLMTLSSSITILIATHNRAQADRLSQNIIELGS